MKYRQAIVAVALSLPFAVGVWLLTRPPATPMATGISLAKALESGNVWGVSKFVFPDEVKALGLTQNQVETVIRSVVIPDYRTLQVQSSQMKLLPTNPYESYLMAPCGPSSSKGIFLLALVQRENNRYHTTLTYLIIGIQKAEEEIYTKQGRRAEYQQRKFQREGRLRNLGMSSLYNASDATTVPIPQS
jgi:hypothetical protein